MVNLKILKICGIVDSRGELYANNFSFNQERFRRSIGSPIMLVAQTGRKRQTERRGVLTETYPSVFVVDWILKKILLNEYLTAIQMYLLGQ